MGARNRKSYEKFFADAAKTAQAKNLRLAEIIERELKVLAVAPRRGASACTAPRPPSPLGRDGVEPGELVKGAERRESDDQHGWVLKLVVAED